MCWEDFLSWYCLLEFCLLLVCSWPTLYLFRLGQISSILFLKIFIGPLCCQFSLDSVPIIFRFGLLLFSCTFMHVLGSKFFHIAFSLSGETMPLMVSLAPEILSSISCILLLMLAHMAPAFFLRFSVSSVV